MLPSLICSIWILEFGLRNPNSNLDLKPRVPKNGGNGRQWRQRWLRLPVMEVEAGVYEFTAIGVGGWKIGLLFDFGFILFNNGIEFLKIKMNFQDQIRNI